MRTQSPFLANTLGSLYYETTKGVHYLLLYITLPPALFGTIGTLYSLIYLTAHLASCEGGASVIPFLDSFMQASRSVFYRRFLIPQVLQLTLGSCGVHLFITRNIVPLSGSTLGVIIILTITEGLRISTRMFLHARGYHRPVLLVGNGTTTLYYGILWGLFYAGFPVLVPSVIFTLFLPVSLGVLIYHGYMLTADAAEHHLHGSPRKKLPSLKTQLWTQGTLAILHIPKNLFSGNFLVPLFAHRFGLGVARTIKITQVLAQSLGAWVRTAIGFTSTRLFITHKHLSDTSKQTLFTSLWNKMLHMIIISCLLIACNIGSFVSLYSMVLVSLFLLITTIDHLFIIYERFFLIEQQVEILACYRGIETLGSLLIVMSTQISPILIVIGIILIRGGALFRIITYTHQHWSIRPQTELSAPLILAGGISGCLSALCIRLFCL